MIDITRYQGMAQFGPAYQIMLENDAHAPGSVDRVLVEHMIRLCPETIPFLYGEYTPVQVRYTKGVRPDLEHCVQENVIGSLFPEQQVEAIARFTAGLGEQVADEGLDNLLIGGTEEEIIQRGSDWCTDIARVACVLCQIAGFPARLVFLADTAQAYSGHDIIEVFRRGAWGAVDPTTAVIYGHPDGRPARTGELMNNPPLVEAHWRGSGTLYTTPGQFRSAALSNYFVADWRDYDYTVSSLNGYYRSILEMSSQGWPGGLRWLHGEETG